MISKLIPIVALFVALSPGAVSGSDGGEAGEKRPNLVFLLTDDQAVDTLGCYGNPDVRTPEIDRLAAEGIVFDNYYNTTAICMASRATVFTGLLEYRHGCNFGHGPLLREHWESGYPVLLRRAGYRTAIAGKIGIEVAEAAGGPGALPRDDFDAWGAGPGQTSYVTKKNSSMRRYAEEYPHATLSYGAFGRDFIEESAEGDAPFCLSISFKAPHRPTTPDPRFDEVYAGKKFRKPANYGREHGEHFSPQSRQGRQYVRFHEWGYADRFDEVMATYHQQIHAVDVAVGMIRDALEKAGVAGNTIVIFTSDNGFLCGSHGYGSKVLPYEESARAPFIFYWPGHENSGRGLRSDALSGNVDVHPTLLELAGVASPEGIDGKSLVPLYEDPTASVRERLPLVNVWGPEAVHSFALVTKDWKLIRWPYDEKGFSPVEELYHLREDPLELVNQLADPGSGNGAGAEAAAAMRDAYDAEVARWKRLAVPYHDYSRHGDRFARD